jgi:hypothetical protein
MHRPPASLLGDQIAEFLDDGRSFRPLQELDESLGRWVGFAGLQQHGILQDRRIVVGGHHPHLRRRLADHLAQRDEAELGIAAFDELQRLRDVLAGDLLGGDRFTKLAIADPTAAPYGAAAVEAMTRMGVYAKLEPKLVKGSSLTQTYQFVSTGAAELGLVALSQVIKQSGGSRWLVPAKFHKPIAQQAVLLKTGANNPAAVAFIKFMKSPQARAIIKRYGYEVR